MRFFVALAVITLFCFASDRCVDAGVMLGESPTPLAIGGCSASMVADLLAAQQDEQQRGSVRQGEPAGMAKVSVSVSLTFSSTALLYDELVLMPTPTFQCVVSLANATLPPSPLRDGLLKPS